MAGVAMTHRAFKNRGIINHMSSVTAKIPKDFKNLSSNDRIDIEFNTQSITETIHSDDG